MEKKKQNVKRIDEWQAQNVERLVIKPRLEDNISTRIDALIEKGIAKSRQSYIIDAIKAQLQKDEKPEG